jgi:sugar lactone lactonase YvrE
MDSAGSLYVGDSGNKTIRQVTTNGVVTTLAGSAELSGSADGTNSSARFAYPFGVTVDPAGNLYVTDTSNFTVRELTPAGVVTTLAGNAGLSGSADGTGKAARFYVPTGVAVNSAGIIYVADTGNSTIRKVTSGGMVTTLAGRAKQTGSVDNTNYQATYFSPGGVAVDNAGNVYVADTYNSTIRKVTSDGGVATLAGSAGLFGSGDGAGSSALFNFPSGVAVDNVGNVYVADSYNSTIRKVTDDGVVATLAGSPGLSGSLDGTGSIARFFDPSSVAVDSAGNVYVTDSGNNTIRKISSSGLVTTLAGSAAASGSADGTGSAARFFNPNGVAVDSAGNVYVADSGNNLVRKITSAGVVTTLAGNAGQSGGADGTNSTALFNFPCNVAVDSAGNVYVADSGNNTIRKVTSGGVVTTIGGNTGVMGGADGLGSWAKFARPRGIAVDGSGRVYVADTGNNRISLGRPLPTINIKKLAMNVVVFWPASFNDLVLQQNFNVSNPIGWSTSSYTNSDDGTNKSVTILSPSANQFFRLMAK